jgi:putative flippase GtrA
VNYSKFSIHNHYRGIRDGKVSATLFGAYYEPDNRMLILIKNLREVYDGTIVIVNDGSGAEYDSLYEMTMNLGCVVLKNYRNCGKGRALKNAFNYCLNTFPDMLGCVTADSDGQHTVADILKCMNKLEDNPNSLILGCRNFDAPDVPAKSRFGNNLTKNVCKLLCGLTVSDTQTGLRGIPRELMAYLLNTNGERFEFETRMLLEAKDQFPYIEVPIETVYDSRENHQTHFDPIKDSIRIYKMFGSVFLKFLFSSVSSSVLDLCLFSIFISILNGKCSHYIALATILARTISATYNYTINYKIVFHSDADHANSAMKYFGLAVGQMFCSAVLTTGGCYLLPEISELIVKIIVDVVLFFISYFIQREFVFKKGKGRLPYDK